MPSSNIDANEFDDVKFKVVCPHTSHIDARETCRIGTHVRLVAPQVRGFGTCEMGPCRRLFSTLRRVFLLFVVSLDLETVWSFISSHIRPATILARTHAWRTWLKTMGLPSAGNVMLFFAPTAPYQCEVLPRIEGLGIINHRFVR